MYFYPRSPCGERLFDAVQIVIVIVFLSTLSLRRATLLTLCPFLLCEFLSTLSLRRATPYIYILVNTFFNFYPRSPCGERPTWKCGWYVPVSISIHALLAESDPRGQLPTTQPPHFYPRSPCGERPITITTMLLQEDFYPRSPCGERPMMQSMVAILILFLSTLSLRRATVNLC